MKKSLITSILFIFVLGHGILPAASENAGNRSANGNESASSYRSYNATLTSKDKEDIRFIITTMGNATNIVQLLTKAGKLTSAGDRILPIHPLLYLKVVFTDEEMKVGMQNIRKSSSLWNNFLNGYGSRKGIKHSLDEEYAKGNITEAQLNDFAAAVKIDPKLVLAAYQKRQWEQFIDLLIKKVPRQGNTKKYDM